MAFGCWRYGVGTGELKTGCTCGMWSLARIKVGRGRRRILRLSGVKNIAAALRHYGWKPWEALTPQHPASGALNTSRKARHERVYGVWE